MARGRLITFEGGEGCGKSTQVRRLAERLQALGRTVRCLREPGGTPLGEKLRHLLKHDPDGAGMAAETELLLMNASRAELVRQVLRPALAAGEIILCDRFFDSTTAYQGHGRGLPADDVQALIRLAVGETRPDLTLWLQVPPEVGRARARARAGLDPLPDRFEAEQEAFFSRVDAGYATLAAAEPKRWVTIDAQAAVEQVATQVWQVIVGRLPELAGSPSPRNDRPAAGMEGTGAVG